MMGAAMQGVGMATATTDDDATDWEYEYADDETEDVYFTLDLTTNVPNALRQREVSGNGKPRRESIKPPLRGTGTASTPGADGEDGNNDDDEDEDDLLQVQIMDLHTESPMLKFYDGVYSCHWMTDLGSQFYLTAAGVTTQPARPGHVVDVVAMSRTRLVAEPVTLVPRSDDNHEKNGGTQDMPIDVDDAAEVESQWRQESEELSMRVAQMNQEPGQPLIIDRSLLKDKSLEPQASFIERFAAIKRQKGENDVVPIMAVKLYGNRSRPVASRPHPKPPIPEATGKVAFKITAPEGEPRPKRKRRTFADMGKMTKAERQQQEKRQRHMWPTSRNGLPTAASSSDNTKAGAEQSSATRTPIQEFLGPEPNAVSASSASAIDPVLLDPTLHSSQPETSGDRDEGEG